MTALTCRLAFLLSFALGAANTSAFSLVAGDVVQVRFDEVPYVETVTSPGHGSTSSLFIDLDPATFGSGDAVQVTLWPSLDSQVPFLTVEANPGQAHEIYGDSWRFRRATWGEPFGSGVLEIKVLSGSVDVDAVTFENFLSDVDFPRGANPGGLDDYNIYRLSITQVPEPPPSVLALGMLAILACARALRKQVGTQNPPLKTSKGSFVPK
ncbi:MAG TPA: hypothetical protein VF773_00765 [Verrucomicrobiae bacterium]